MHSVLLFFFFNTGWFFLFVVTNNWSALPYLQQNIKDRQKWMSSGKEGHAKDMRQEVETLNRELEKRLNKRFGKSLLSGKQRTEFSHKVMMLTEMLA